MRPEDTLAMEYVLGLVDETTRAEAERRLGADPIFAAEIAAWRVRFAELDDTADTQAAGEDLWKRIEASLPAARPPAPLRPQVRRRRVRLLWENVVFWRIGAFAAGAASIVLAMLLGWNVLVPPRPNLVAVLLTDRAEPGAIVQAFADGRAVLIPLGAISVPQDRALQVWTLPSSAARPIPIGLFREVRSGRLSLEAAPAPAQLFEITLEPAGGSPTGRPTGPVLMKGFASRTY